MAVKTTTGYSFPTIPAKYDSTDKTFINAVKKLFDTLFSFKSKMVKDIEKAPSVAWDKLYPVGIVIWSGTSTMPRSGASSGEWTGVGSVTTDENKTLYAFKRTA